MPIRFVNASVSGLDIPNKTVYTCPAGVTAVVMSVNGAATGEASLGANIDTSLTSGATTTFLSKGITVANGSAASLVPAKIGLAPGDSIRAALNSENYRSVFVISKAAPTTIRTTVSNGSVVIGFATYGIYRSTDSGVTWTLVSSLTVASNSLNCAAYIGTNFYCYTSATAALKSTDNGLTWTSIAVTNAPTTRANAAQHVVFNGSVHGGLTAAGNLTTTTNGETWTNATAFAAVCTGLAWTGLYWVACRQAYAVAGTAEIYYSTTGASWTSVTIPTGLGAGITSSSAGGIASDGNGRVLVSLVNTGTNYLFSTNHGLAFGAPITSGDAASTTKPVGFINGQFVALAISSPASSLNIGPAIGFAGFTRQSLHASGYLATRNITVSGTKALVCGNSGVLTSADLDFTAAGGSDVTVSVMEQY